VDAHLGHLIAIAEIHTSIMQRRKNSAIAKCCCEAQIADALFGQSSNRLFFIEQTTGTNKARSRQIKSCVGELSTTEKQGQKLGLEPRTHLSPVLEKCSLRLCAKGLPENKLFHQQ
jgi:hypothetical protein